MLGCHVPRAHDDIIFVVVVGGRACNSNNLRYIVDRDLWSINHPSPRVVYGP